MLQGWDRAEGAPRRGPPKGPVVLVGLMLTLAVLSIVTGIVDIVLPAIRGEEPFTLLMTLVQHFGPAYLFLHILVHNAGLACLVPGIGLVALSYERSPKNRLLAARILLVTVALSLLVALEYLFQARERFDLMQALPLLALEAVAVLVLAWRGYRVLRDFVPTPRKSWAFVHPARELAPWVTGVHATLAFAAVIEVFLIL